jgi:hypothetical protein
VISPHTYLLKLPNQWWIHPVFHAALLSPYRETDAHGQNYLNHRPTWLKDKKNTRLKP